MKRYSAIPVMKSTQQFVYEAESSFTVARRLIAGRCVGDDGGGCFGPAEVEQFALT